MFQITLEDFGRIEIRSPRRMSGALLFLHSVVWRYNAGVSARRLECQVVGQLQSGGHLTQQAQLVREARLTELA